MFIISMKKPLIIIAFLVIGGVAYYGVSPLFRNKRVDEALPNISQTTKRAEPVTKSSISSPVVGTPAHPASGTARIVTVDGKSYARFENFKTINGPDVYVYLANDLNAKDIVDLGPLKATEGNINYEIPAGVGPKKYKYVIHWCKRFSVLFNYAEIRY